MATYLVLIYGDEKTWDEASDEWGEENAAGHRAFAAAAGDAVLGGHELERPGRAVSLRGTGDGQVARTAGPFMSTEHVLGGYYLLEAPDLEEAVRLASLIPEAAAPTSGVEVRPVSLHD